MAKNRDGMLLLEGLLFLIQRIAGHELTCTCPACFTINMSIPLTVAFG